jgi:hypothetical protein
VNRRYGPSATELLREASSAEAVDAILASARQLYAHASAATRREWERVAAVRKKDLPCR